MAYYKEKTETGNEYVLAIKKFYLYTLNKCLKFPQRWYDTMLKPVINSAERARNYVIKANKVYVNYKNQSLDEFNSSIEERDKYLIEALKELAVFDDAFEVLISYIDIESYEKTRMKKILEKIINNIKDENKELSKIEITLEHKENEICFVSLLGNVSTRLKITYQNIEHWISLEKSSIEKIKERINKDKQILKQLNNK